MDPSETISPSTPYLNYSTRRNLSHPPPPPPPPSAKAEDNELLIEHVNSNVDSLLNKYPDALIVLAGDFNPNSTNISLSALARDCGLTQLVKVPTRGNNILDWCLVNKPKLFDEPVQLQNIGSSDHFSILINPSAPNYIIRERHVYKREMKDSNVRAFGRWICNDPWSGEERGEVNDVKYAWSVQYICISVLM